jgi:peptidoglycan/xylan/chitin deacetylase (PgdA/CDA1 family)
VRTVVPILLYHSISSEAAPRFRQWAVPPAHFAAHLAYLYEAGYTSLTVTEFVAARKNGLSSLPGRPVVLTFDDGFADFHSHALPLLQRFGFTATLYVVTEFVSSTSQWLKGLGEGQRPMLNWKQISEIAASGIEIGAHTARHLPIDTLSTADAQQEIRGSKETLEHRLAQPVHSFAYPHGYHNTAVKQLVQEAGYNSACAFKHAMSALDDDPFGLSRAFVFADTHVSGLRRLLTGDGLRIAPQGESAQTRGWRLARRSAYLLKRSLSLVHATAGR